MCYREYFSEYVRSSCAADVTALFCRIRRFLFDTCAYLLMCMAKEAYLYGKRDLCVWQTRPTGMAKEAYLYGKRGVGFF